MNAHIHPPKTPSRRLPPWLAGLLSLTIPGLGQVLLGETSRGGGLLFSLAVMAGLILWRAMPILFVPLIAVWLWGVWDAVRCAQGRPSKTVVPFLIGALIVYALGVEATEIRPRRLVTGWPSMQPILRALTRPELLTHPTEDRIGWTPFQVPCVDPLPPPDTTPSEEPRVVPNVRCAEIGDVIEITGEGFFPNFKGEVWWVNPIGDVSRAILNGQPVTFVTDETGRFRATLVVPLAIPRTQLPPPGETQTHQIRAEQHKPYGALQPTETLNLVLKKIGETIALAFLATVLAVIFALPLSFLAARNLMGGYLLTRIIYYAMRTVFNVVRSIETLMWAIIFAVWVGLGPFDGTLALLLHSIAALGKLYSEAIESIDPGPIEAVRATGANGIQVIVYAVLPQFMPTFLSFTLYRWDINVRMSTVIGLVSNAGLGFLVIQWIRLNRYSSMATSIIAIVLVIALLDYVSAAVRKRIIAGVPSQRRGKLRRYVAIPLLVLGLIAMFIWSWNVAEVNIPTLVEGASDGLRLARAFLVPKLTTRPIEERRVSAVLPVPCGSGEPASPPSSGPRVVLSTPCAAPGDPLTIQGYELPPNTEVSVRWVFSDGSFLRVRTGGFRTDATGNLTLKTKVHPLMEVNPEAGRAEPGHVEIVWKEVIGGPRPSEALVTTLNLSLVTLLMALLATTIGAVIAIPLSFLAAHNIMGQTAIGRWIYYLLRTIFNLWRSIEPMILAVICATWVGLGPFAGVLALALNNIPNLGKLFSEAIEVIDTGPVEAVTATGANRLQTLVYAIIPQIVPRFLAFILYQWDINIRMSTVIGFVGGGGIGQQFRVWVGLNQYAAAGTATWAIVAMVWSMDYISAKVRERIL